MFSEEPRALHCLRFDQNRWDDRRETGLHCLVQRELEQRELEQRADACEVVEPCAGDLRPALSIDGSKQFTQLKVVLGGFDRWPRSDLAKHDEIVFPSVRCPILDHVGDGEMGLPQRGLRVADRGF